MVRVEIFQTSDKEWHLQTYDAESCQVYMLLTFSRLIWALDTACTLQLHVDNADELPIHQYKKADDVAA